MPPSIQQALQLAKDRTAVHDLSVSLRSSENPRGNGCAVMKGLVIHPAGRVSGLVKRLLAGAFARQEL